MRGEALIEARDSGLGVPDYIVIDVDGIVGVGGIDIHSVKAEKSLTDFRSMQVRLALRFRSEPGG